VDDDKSLVPDIRIDQFEGHATITRPGSDPIELSLQNAESLRSIVTKYALQVEQASRPLRLSVSPDAAQHFISFVKHSAHRCFEEATDDEYDVLQDAFDSIMDEIAKTKLRGEPLCVEITDNSGEYLPWEWLGELDRAEDYLSEALSTLGFAAIVYRRAVRHEARANRETATGRLDAQPRLPVRFFSNPQLYGTRLEEWFFRHNDYVDLLGPFPEKSADGQLDLAEQLVDPGQDRPDHPDQVVHMSCHHETNINFRRASPAALLLSDSRLRFGTQAEPNFEIPLPDLRHNLMTVRKQHKVMGARPLIFFNACRGNFYPFMTESAVRVLLRNGNRGMISTAVRVPDGVAAKLALYFYERLLDGGCTVPEALLYAKWALLHSKGNPLGLLYSYCGIPGLRVLPVRQVPGENPIVTIWNGGSP
jgi:hypothetical protein